MRAVPDEVGPQDPPAEQDRREGHEGRGSQPSGIRDDAGRAERVTDQRDDADRPHDSCEDHGRDVRPGKDWCGPALQPRRDPRVEPVGIEGRVDDGEVARVEEQADPVQVVDRVRAVHELVRPADRGQDRDEGDDDTEADRDDDMGIGPAEEASSRRQHGIVPADGMDCEPAEAGGDRRDDGEHEPVPAEAKALGNGGPGCDDAYRDGRGHGNGLESSSAEGSHDEPARREQRDEEDGERREGVPPARPARQLGHHGGHSVGHRDFAAPRVRAYDERRSRVLRLARPNSRVFCRVRPGAHHSSPSTVPRAPLGGVRAGARSEAYAAGLGPLVGAGCRGGGLTTN